MSTMLILEYRKFGHTIRHKDIGLDLDWPKIYLLVDIIKKVNFKCTF